MPVTGRNMLGLQLHVRYRPNAAARSLTPITPITYSAAAAAAAAAASDDEVATTRRP